MNIDDYLSKEQYDLVDSWSGKPVAKVRYVIEMPSELFNEHRHKMVCVTVGMWAYVDSIVTREECVELYGPITEEVYGPRGGWKSVTFGTTKFKSEYLRPANL
jgi:hypothetical protein